uniref:Reverse transcriptase domain-containing protein n=1 Tax=Cannabis sativa TaxID=3483 RepID=A0A803P669_CANSA
MNEVLYEFLDRFIVVYLDDIVTYNTSLEEYLQHLRKVLTKLREEKLYIKKEKFVLCKKEVKFIGHWVGRGNLVMDEGKIKAIMDWPFPTKVAKLRSFLGLANYYRNFIKGYSKKVSDLTDLLEKDHRWHWSEECNEAFEKFPDFNLPFEVQTDASEHALGGVLVSSTFIDRVREQSLLDPGYKKLLEEARNGELMWYWEEDDLLYAKGGKLFVPNSDGLQREFLKETHDTQWDGPRVWLGCWLYY